MIVNYLPESLAPNESGLIYITIDLTNKKESK